ncbi:MAG: hypothetical protein FWG02_09960 [Holophagaceae bacterium]|nr:hypothetical protein [Holophagaceae bacterium]
MKLHDTDHRAVIEYGDFQTPNSFAVSICQKLATFYDLSPDIVLEPTFGTGSFVRGALSTFHGIKTLYGIEINENYYKTVVQQLKETQLGKTDVEICNENFFTFDFGGIKKSITLKNSMLIIGNPPWVTNAQLTSLGSSNLPKKNNFKGHSGFDAMTGKSNFDIAECIILRLLSEFANCNCTLAMLCKSTVAKNLVRDINKYNFTVSTMDMFVFDAKEIFGVSCDAGLLVAQLGGLGLRTCSVYDFYSNEKQREFGWVGNLFCADTKSIPLLADIDGKCQFEWRQGIKHDCSKIMELETTDQLHFQNGIGETFRFHIGKYVFPLVKSSDIKSLKITKTRKFVIVPQRQINEDTTQIQYRDSAVWDYLQCHEHYLATRRSAIYKNSPKYSVFGVGDYSFSKYKIGISGFYKKPVFSLIEGEIPIMVDDTCYFLSFDDQTEAVITLSLLNSPKCLAFLSSIVFLDSKRPYTKEVLQRIDLAKLSAMVDFDFVYEFSKPLLVNSVLDKSDYDQYCLRISAGSASMLFYDN